MRAALVFLILLFLKGLSRLFFRLDMAWVGDVPDGDPWKDHRIVAILNHTSLFEWLLVGAPPNRFLWQIAAHGVVPVADVTLQRPLVGAFFRFVARHVVSITRERDHTWQTMMNKIDDPQSLAALAPEGRMMRPDGLDKNSKPMTVRGGVADLIESVDRGRLLLAYSGGLHHIQAPGEHLPRLFKPIRLRLESLDIPTYRAEILARSGAKGFKRALVRDLEARRDRYCWEDPTKRPGAEHYQA